MQAAPTLRQVRSKGRTVKDYRPSAFKRGYGSRWQRLRLLILRRDPLCVRCLKSGLTVPADTVDHITPHKGIYELMWNPDNLQGLCTPCHNSKTAKEDGGFGRNG